MLQLSFYLAMIDGEEEQHKFEQLYHAYEGLLLYRAKQLLSDFQLAEAASTTFVYIAKNINMVEQVESPRTKALLLQVLNHTAIDLARKQRREQSHRGDFAEIEQYVAPERTDAITEHYLDEALERLPWPYQQVILLKYANGYNNKEIAALLGYTVSKSRKIAEPGQKEIASAFGRGAAAMKFTEEELRRAAVRVQEKQLAALPAPETCTDIFSPAYAQKLQQLSEELKRGQLAQAVAPMGWQYYTRRSIAAILLCFLLACATMPEAVLAGYQKMLETVQEICELYTQLRYNSHVTVNTKFVPLQPTYLPDGLEEVKKRRNRKYGVDLLYMDNENGRYFKMYQCLFDGNR